MALPGSSTYRMPGTAIIQTALPAVREPAYLIFKRVHTVSDVLKSCYLLLLSKILSSLKIKQEPEAAILATSAIDKTSLKMEHGNVPPHISRAYQRLLARRFPAMPGFHDSSKQYLFRHQDNEFLVDWDTLRTWPRLLEACQNDNLYLFDSMDTRQACCCIRVIKSNSVHIGSDEYLEPILSQDACLEDNDSDRLIHHLKIYEFATFYNIDTLRRISFHHLKLAADNLGFVLLAGILSKQSFQFNSKDSWFISYMRERAKMDREILTEGDRSNVDEDWQFSKTLENFLLGTIVDMKMEIQQLKAAVAAAAANNNGPQ